MSQRGRRIGCLAFGVFWVLLLILTIGFFALGDCERDPNTGNCLHQPVHLERIVFGGEFLLFVGVGWLFYRREMKDDQF